jgi:hypothetical protein
MSFDITDPGVQELMASIAASIRREKLLFAPP